MIVKYNVYYGFGILGIESGTILITNDDFLI